MNNKNKLERNLIRQLKHCDANLDTPITSVDEWQSFLHSVNRSYIGNKESRYLLEKSLDESSQEMRKLYSDLKEETEQRVKALQESEEKTRFMANMSHEIRTPIHGILGSLEIVKNNSALDDKQKAFIGTAFASAESLLGIINNILDFSNITADQLKLENDVFDIRQLINETNKTASPNAVDKQLNMEWSIDENVPTSFKGDSIKIRQILTNLLSNSIKFTDKGSISTNVSLVQQSGEISTIRIQVEDTGIGVPKAMQKNIFDAFIQEDASTTRQYEGTGLGLTIIKELTQLMNGKIYMKSKKDVGSRFWIDIPLENVADLDENNIESDLDGLRVLAIDGIKSNRAILNHYLSQWNITVDLAGSGKEAIIHLLQSKEKQKHYDIIIMDNYMSGKDGLLFFRKLNTDSIFSHIPRIILTSQGNMRHARESQETSITLEKPIRKSMLKKSLMSCIDLQIRKKSIVEDNEPSDEDNKLFELHDGYLKLIPEYTDILLAEDNEVNALIAVTVIEQMGFSVKHVTDGKQALDEAKHGHYRSILMDMHMPVMDGYKATQKIREWESNNKAKATPIIALTANSLIGDKEKCLSFGMDDYLSKPVRQESLKEIISKWVKKDISAPA